MVNVSLTMREMNLIWDAVYATRGRRGNYKVEEQTTVMKKMAKNNKRF